MVNDAHARHILTHSIFQLHGKCRESTPVQLIDQGWHHLRQGIAFDGGCWLRGQASSPVSADAHRLLVSAQLVEEVLPLLPLHRCSSARQCRPAGSALAISYAAPDSAPALRAFGSRHGFGHALVLAGRDGSCSPSNDFILWRRAAQEGFAPADGDFLAALAPHLTEALGVSRLVAAVRQHPQRRVETHSCAIADASGHLQLAQRGFRDLVALEFAGWHGPVLPGDLRGILGDPGLPRYLGEHMVVRALRRGDTWLLRARERHPLDRLSARELEVARLAAHGLTHGEIADQLGIAAATARNHLNNIRVKTGVPKLSEVAAWLLDLE